MPDPKRPLKVFLCHAHADRDRVHALYTRLTKDGVDAWLDKEKLLPGQDWELEISKAVHESDVVVICISNQFNQKGFRQKEVKWALNTAMELPEQEIFIIPARLEECETPDNLRRWHWVDLFENDGYERLMRSLEFKVRKSTPSVKLPQLLELLPRTEKALITVSSPTYVPERFVDRQEEIQQIISILQASQPRVRAIVFDGERGSGKLWLSLHLHRTIFQQLMGITSWLFSLSPTAEGYTPWGETVQANECFVRNYELFDIKEFLALIVKNLELELPPNPGIAETVDTIRRYVQGHSDERFVLILDSAYESDWSILEQLETHFLGNLLTLRNFFVIANGRGRPYPWKIPYLIEAVRFGLRSFSIDQLQEQIEKFGLSPVLSANEVYEIGDGLPLFTEFISHAKNRVDALESASNLLFSVIPIQERAQIGRYFEALCPLDGFGESEAALMVEAYNPLYGKVDGRLICRKMNESRLISWKNGRYVISQPVQNVLRQYLSLNKHDDWIRLNSVAYSHYRQIRDDPSMSRFRSFFEAQMMIHAKVLSEGEVQSEQ